MGSQTAASMADIPPFVKACRDNKISEVRRLIRQGVNVNVNVEESKRRGGETGLHAAMSNNYVEVLSELLGHRDIDLTVGMFVCRVWMTPLHYGCWAGKQDAVKLFLKHPKCTIDIINMRTGPGGPEFGEKTAEMIALENGHIDCARLVREAGGGNEEFEEYEEYEEYGVVGKK